MKKKVKTGVRITVRVAKKTLIALKSRAKREDTNVSDLGGIVIDRFLTMPRIP